MTESERFGMLAEAAARARYQLTKSRCSWHDATLPSGRPVEIKACRRRLRNGRRGRWRIFEDAHQRLTANGGMYALALYDPQALDGPILDIALLPASWLGYLLQWSASNHHKGDSQAKLGWPHVLDGPKEVVA